MLDYSPEHIIQYLFLDFRQALLLSIVSLFYWCYTFMSRVWLRNVKWHRSRTVRHQKLQCIYLCLCTFHFHDYIIRGRDLRKVTVSQIRQKPGQYVCLSATCCCFKPVSMLWIVSVGFWSFVMDTKLCCSWLVLFDLILVTAWLIGLAHSQCCHGAMLPKSTCVRLLTGVSHGVCRCRFH